MGNIINIARWEWFKLQRRRMPWILLAILFAFTQLSILGSYLSYRSAVNTGGRAMVPFRATGAMPRMLTCNDVQSASATNLPANLPPQVLAAVQEQCRLQAQLLPNRYRALMPTGSISSALGVMSFIGLVMLGILSASIFGSEYGLGTLRPILVRGIGRSSFLAGKFGMLVVATTAAILLISAAAALSGLLASHFAVAPGNRIAAESWTHVLGAFARTWASLTAYAALACAITVLTRSTAAGMALSLGYYVVESIFIRLMTAAFSWFETVGDYLPMRNISALGRASINMAPGGAAGSSNISTLHASLVVAAYVVVFAAIATVVFRRRDIVGASGG